MFRSPRIAPVYFAGDRHLQLHDRLQQHRPGRQEGVLEGDAAGRLERRFRAVHGVVLAEVDLHGHVLNAIAGQGPALQQFLAALLYGRDELVGDRAADDGVDEARSCASARNGPNASSRTSTCWRTSPSSFSLTVDLARQRDRCACGPRRTDRDRRSASCADAGLRRRRHRLAIRDLRLVRDDFQVETPFQPVAAARRGEAGSCR